MTDNMNNLSESHPLGIGMSRMSSSMALNSTSDVVQPRPAGRDLIALNRDEDLFPESADSFPGPYCRSALISSSGLLAESSLPKVPVVSNGLALEIYNFTGQSDHSGHIIKQLSPQIDDLVANSSIRVKLYRLKSQVQSMKKTVSKRTEIERLLDLPFTISGKSSYEVSKSTKANIKVLKENTLSVVTENCSMKRQLDEQSAELDIMNQAVLDSTTQEHRVLKALKKVAESRNIYRKETQSLQKEIRDTNESIDLMKADLEKTKKIISSSSVRNLNKRLKRREETIASLQSDNTNLKKSLAEDMQELEQIHHDIEQKEENSISLQEEKIKLQKQVSYFKGKVSKTSLKFTENIDDVDQQCWKLEQETTKLKKEITQLEQENELLRSQVIPTFDDGRYTNITRETIMALLTECNVSTSKVNQVITIVLKNLTGTTPERLPSQAVLSRLLVEARTVAQAHVASSILSEAKPEDLVGSCLQSDATSKFHRHYQSFQVSLPSGQQLSMGMSEVGSGTAKTVMSAFEDLVGDLTNSLGKSSDEDHVSKIIAGITSTMSDQGAVNPLFNSMLKELRENVLPNVIAQWGNMSGNDQKKISQISHFFCKMHLVANFPGECDSSLELFEDTVVTGRNPHSFECKSGAFRLIRTACKALTSHGCEKSGMGGLFNAFLFEKEKKNALVTFRGARFNIVFLNGGAVYYHRHDIKAFLEDLVDRNQLLESVLFDIKEDIYLAGTRALGIVDKIITGPFWRAMEQKENILDMNTYLHQMQLQLRDWSKDASGILSGELVFTDIDIHKDKIYDELFEATTPEFDTITQMALEVLMHSLLLIFERQAKDQLPGGKYWEPNDDINQRGAHVGATNTVSERDFGQLDLLVQTKPAASTICFEAIILWCNNKTRTWLDNLGEHERNSLLDNARSSAPSVKKKFRERIKLIKIAKLEQMKEKKKKQDEKETRSINNQSTLTRKLTDFGGLWDTDNVETQLEKITTATKKKEAMLTQINFHKDVLKSKGDRKLFHASCKGKALPLHQLEDNLRTILDLNRNCNEAESSNTQGLQYRSLEEAKSLMQDTKVNLVKKLQQNQDKILIQQQKDLLPYYMENSNELTGRKIKHKCYTEENEVEWFPGKVTSVYKKHKDALKIEFNVVYDEDNQNESWHFNILRDLKNGDLIIV